MQLNAVREGDIVRVNDGLPYLAIVTAKYPRRLTVSSLDGSFALRTVKAAWITAHWRKAKTRAADS
jgi:hypothetical protein